MDLEKEKEEILKWKGDTSFQEIVLAVLKGRTSNDYDSAINELARLEQKDAGNWIFDLLILGKAELAQKFQHANDEEQYITGFMKKQPLLFEPHHVFNFGWLEIQESMKKRYQAIKKEADEGLRINYYFV